MRDFILLEPSKVGTQHISLIEGYITAFRSLDLKQHGYRFILACSQFTHETLSLSVREGVPFRPVSVVDPHSRRLIKKSLVELWCVVSAMWRMRSGDKLLVTALLPTTLFLVEIANLILRRHCVYVVLHGELEALVDAALRPNPKNYGFWTWQWWRTRPKRSLINIVVIDEFIREKLLEEGKGLLRKENVLVLDHPISPSRVSLIPTKVSKVSKVCFIGFRTRNKGYFDFLDAALANPELEFVAIGDGKVENITTNEDRELANAAQFYDEIATCHAAFFPYVGGYSISLSAAAIDALSAGLLIIAKPRGCFRALQERYGPNVVKCYETVTELTTILDRLKMETASDRRQRLETISQSPFGQIGLVSQAEELLRHEQREGGRN